MIAGAVALALLSVALAGPVSRLLATAGWPSRAPGAGVLLWQAVGLAGGLAAIGAGLLVAVAPVAPSLPEGLLRVGADAVQGRPGRGLGPVQLLALAWAVALGARLLGVLLVSAVRTLRARRRHRVLVDLVGTPWPDLGGARVLDAADPVAYCLPGLRPRVVLSAGTLSLLAPAEVEAVLDHERAHASQRHDLVVLPFVALGATLPWLPGVRRAQAAVATLIEMLADDRARDRAALASALVRVGTSGVPQGALGAAEAAVVARVRRLLDPKPAPAWLRAVVCLVAVGLVGVPTLLLALPLLV